MQQPLIRRLTRQAPAGALCAAFALAGCAPRLAPGFVAAKSSGDRAYSAGRYEEAASHYEKAASEADRPRDQAEALYLVASSFQRNRAPDRARAAYERLIAEIPTSDLARRARFDLADLEIDSGQTEKGYELYRRLVLDYPNDALARRALERYLGHLEASGGNALAWLRGILPQIASTPLDETARYRIAGYLEAQEDRAGARDVYLECAARHPYPEGALFDDALWHASMLDEALGRPSDAIADLKRMLATREKSTMMGSYERPRFSAAQFRLASLYRDAVRDPAAARREFHRLYTEHPTSILRDDALWEEAKLARESGDVSGACALAAALAKDFPGSRYAPCAQTVCPSAPSGKGRCHTYLVRDPAREPGGSEEPTTGE